MNSRIKNKKNKQRWQKIKKRTLNKKNTRNYYVKTDHQFLKGIMPEEYIDMECSETTEVAIFPTKPSKQEIEFYEKYGVPKQDTWSADMVLIPYIIELAHATIEAGSIVDWNYQPVDIPIVNEEGMIVEQKETTIPECVRIMTEYFKEYLLSDYSLSENVDYELVRKKLQTGFTILGIIAPALWW